MHACLRAKGLKVFEKKRERFGSTESDSMIDRNEELVFVSGKRMSVDQMKRSN